MNQCAEATVAPTAGSARPRRPGRAAAVDLIFLSFAAFALYAAALRNGFVYDDETEILKDPLIRSFAGVPRLFAHSVWYFLGGQADRYYRPLKLVAYTVEYRLFGFHSAAWHAANLLFHVAVVIAIYLLVCDLGSRQLAFWTALLFAFHPIHVEAVAWISAGNDLLCGLALVLALWLYHRARSGRSPTLNYGLSAFIFFAGLLFKETALTFPAVLLAYDFFYRRESPREMLRGWPRYLGYLAALGAYLAMRWHALGGFAPDNPDLHLTGKQFLLTVPVLAAQYVWKSLVPVHLKAWYTFHPSAGLGFQTLAATGLVLVLVAAMFWLRRRQPVLAFALAWFWLTLAPVLDVPKLGDDVFTERYLYIPTLGFCILAAWLITWLGRPAARPVVRRTAYAAAAAVLVFYAFVLVRRLPDWLDTYRLSLKTAQQDPTDPVSLAGAGTACYNRGRYQDALGYFQRAVVIAPDKGYIHDGLGAAYFAIHRYDDALAQFQSAAALDPTAGEYWRNAGIIYANRRQWSEAVQAFRHAVENVHPVVRPAPEASAIYVQFAVALWNDGRRDEALDAYRRAIDFDPASLDPYIQLASALSQNGRLDDAASELASGLRSDPRSPKAYLAHFDLSRIYQRQGKQSDADRELRLAMALNPTLGATPLGLQPLTPVIPAKGSNSQP